MLLQCAQMPVDIDSKNELQTGQTTERLFAETGLRTTNESLILN